METIDKIKKQIAENPILIYMKGSPKLPSCGFSARASEALMNCKVPFGYVDILQHPDIRAELPAFANFCLWLLSIASARSNIEFNFAIFINSC